MITQSPINLMSLDRESMGIFFVNMGEKSFRSKQLLRWIYQRRVVCYQDMSDFSKSLRQKLIDTTSLSIPEIVSQKISCDHSIKWLLKLKDGNCIETVYLPEKDRGTLCVSSQVGCSLNCAFCATGRHGYNRNLEVDEIISQLWIANHILESYGYPSKMHNQYENHSMDDPCSVTNVVMMGMGEPLSNFENVVHAMRLMMDHYSFGLSKRKVTLSTAGMVPMIKKLRETCPVNLAVSLHAPFDELRNKLVPLNKKYPINQLLDACRFYVGENNRHRVTFEYVMLANVNDTPVHAKLLANLLQNTPCKVNLIPFNPSHEIPYQRSKKHTIDRFREILLSKGILTITRKTRGDDIKAACGQLIGTIVDRTRRSKKMS